MNAKVKRQALAYSLASKAKLSPVRILEGQDFGLDYFPRNLNAAVIRASVAGGVKVFGAHVAVSREVCKEQQIMKVVEHTLKLTVIETMKRLLANNESIIGPKGKLPA